MKLVVIAVLVSWAAPGSPARAEPAPSAPSGPVTLPAPATTDLRVVRQYTAAAIAASKNSDFETAIDMYQKAYAMTPHPVLLWDLAQAHRRAADKFRDTDRARAAEHRDLARAFYRRFLETQPDRDTAGKARAWLAQLDQQWAEQHLDEEAAQRSAADHQRAVALAAERARLDAEHQRIAERDRIERARIESAVVRTATEHELGQGRTVQISGLAGIAAGGLGLVVAAYYGLRARRISDDLTRRDVFDPDRISEGRTAQRLAAIAGIAGGGVAIGGAITYWIGRRIDARAVERSRLVAAPVGRGAVVGVVGRF